MPHDRRPIRVLLVAPSTEIVGGQSLQAQQLIAQFRQEPSLEPGFLRIDPHLPRPLAVVPYLRTFLRMLLYLPALLWVVPRYDILHVFAAGYWSFTLWSLPAIVVGRLLGKKVLVHYHTGEAEDHLGRCRGAVPALMLAHEIVTPSKYVVNVFARFGLGSRAIPNTLDQAAFHYRRRTRLRPVFLTNRGLEPLYNVGCVLRAFGIIQKRYSEAALVVAHDGSCRAQLEKLAAELSLRNTVFVGAVPPIKMAALYDAADLYLMSPDHDCMPGSVLECFASGLPVIATKAGGVPYIVKHEQTGMLVGCGDYGSLAECAMLLLGEPDFALRLADTAFQECEKYRAGTVGAAWVRLYRKLAAAAPA